MHLFFQMAWQIVRTVNAVRIQSVPSTLCVWHQTIQLRFYCENNRHPWPHRFTREWNFWLKKIQYNHTHTWTSTVKGEFICFPLFRIFIYIYNYVSENTKVFFVFGLQSGCFFSFLRIGLRNECFCCKIR